MTKRPLPTPEEIAERCQAIQASWTPAERKQRWAVAHSLKTEWYGKPPVIPVVRLADLVGDE